MYSKGETIGASSFADWQDPRAVEIEMVDLKVFLQSESKTPLGKSGFSLIVQIRTLMSYPSP